MNIQRRRGRGANILGRATLIGCLTVSVATWAMVPPTSVSAADYPPNATTETTETTLVGGAGGDGGTADESDPDRESTEATVDPPTGELPATGTDNDQLLMVAGGVLLTGTGLTLASRRRRRPA